MNSSSVCVFVCRYVNCSRTLMSSKTRQDAPVCLADSTLRPRTEPAGWTLTKDATAPIVSRHRSRTQALDSKAVKTIELLLATDWSSKDMLVGPQSNCKTERQVLPLDNVKRLNALEVMPLNTVQRPDSLNGVCTGEWQYSSFSSTILVAWLSCAETAAD